MALSDIANSIDRTLKVAERKTSIQEQTVVEHDTRKMAHHIIAYAIERAEEGCNPADLGRACIEGALFGEQEVGGEPCLLADPVVEFLDQMLQGAKQAFFERVGAENPNLSPVDTAVQYYLAHQDWPEGSPYFNAQVKAKAQAKLTALKAQRNTTGKATPKSGTFL